MDLSESLENPAQDELDHWWFFSRARFAHQWLTQAGARVSVLEAGCGTGQNLRFLRSTDPQSKLFTPLVGVDPALAGASVDRDWLGPEDRLLEGVEGLTEPPFAALLCMDVLEHIRLPEPLLESYLNHIRPGAGVLITVPAFQFLWSRHDQDLGHYRRYRTDELRKIAANLGLEVEKTGYLFGFAVIPAFLRKFSGSVKSDNSLKIATPSPILNTLLKALSLLEIRWNGNPWIGTSAFLLARKPKK